MVQKLWKDPVWSAVIAAGIVAVATYLLGYWPQIWQFVKSIPSLLATPLNVPLWTLLLAVPTLLLAIPFIASLKSVKEPGFVSYKRDTIFDINWSWRWLPPGFYNSHYTIQDLIPRCPSCGAVLTINDYGGDGSFALVDTLN